MKALLTAVALVALVAGCANNAQKDGCRWEGGERNRVEVCAK